MHCLLLASFGLGCGAPFPERPPAGDRAGDGAFDAAGPPRLRFEPPASPSGVAPITRIEIDVNAIAADVRVLLVSGVASAAQLRDFARGTPPQTLTARGVGALVWAESSGTTLVVAPLARLDAGGSYTVLVSAPSVALPFTVGDVAPPVLARVWPSPRDAAPTASAAVWCGQQDLSEIDAQAVLEPAGISGTFARGTGAAIPAARCLGWFSANAPSADPAVIAAVSPPALTLGDGAVVALEPTLLWSGAAASTSAIACAAEEIAFGRGCATVEDDRVVVRAGSEPLLWTVDREGGAFIRATDAASSFTLRPIPADGHYRIATLDRGGRVEQSEVAVTPGPARAHVVINEVMANPAGPEPAQEWVELFNDGAASLELGGFGLEDSGGAAVLPATTMEPGSFALIVPQTFVPDDGVDPAPAEGTQLVRVASLGKNGLANDGERLVLRDPAGTIVSVFPAAKSKSGVSIARVAPGAPDDDPLSFEPSLNGSATPGAPNSHP